ncbi:hypothetical protein NIES2101_16510 [Calothrix sp. HK-06]|nr:hypothetical protein NIES2101_16510 [Calothrix sp. HK-06]
MTYANEYTLVEKPCIGTLTSFGYTYLPPQQNQVARDTLNEVILRDIFITSIQRINEIPEEAARATYQDMLRVTDNEQWTNLLRGNYSRNVPGESTKKTIRLVDFLNPENNTFTVTNQFYVKSQNARRPDIVIFINGFLLLLLKLRNHLQPKIRRGKLLNKLNSMNVIFLGCSIPMLLISLLTAPMFFMVQLVPLLRIGEVGRMSQKV